MSRGLVVITGAVLLLAAVASLSTAQGAKPWEQQGTKAGDEIIGPDGGAMVWVPAGEFDMGQQSVATPVHRVRISKSFWLGRCTVTLGQWKSYCRAVGIEIGQASAPGLNVGDDHPVVMVSWDEARAYARHYGLSLPMEAQWEYAARGPEDRRYPWGNGWDPRNCCNSANLGPERSTFPVGSFPAGASWCGALDMAGNVWQWCEDWYSKQYYANSPDTDPPGPDTGDVIPGLGKCRALHGGSWYGGAASCRCAYRTGLAPTDRIINVGFRCVRGL